MIIRVKSYGLCAGQEGVQAHGRLCSLLEQGDAVLMGNPAAWIPKVAHPSHGQPRRLDPQGSPSESVAARVEAQVATFSEASGKSLPLFRV